MISPYDLIQKSISLSSLTNEFDWRQSTHLAYYAVYHQLLECAQLKNINLLQGTGGVHHRAITAIQNYSEQGAELAYWLKKMKKLRVSADYHISDDFLQEDTLIQQDLMKRCLNGLANL